MARDAKEVGERGETNKLSCPAMIDVFCRVIESLEPSRGRIPGWWLLLVGAIGGELFYAFGLFKWSALGLVLGRIFG